MKSFIVLTAVAVLTIGNAIAAMPGAAGSMRTISAAQPDRDAWPSRNCRSTVIGRRTDPSQPF